MPLPNLVLGRHIESVAREAVRPVGVLHDPCGLGPSDELLPERPADAVGREPVAEVVALERGPRPKLVVEVDAARQGGCDSVAVGPADRDRPGVDLDRAAAGRERARPAHKPEVVVEREALAVHVVRVGENRELGRRAEPIG